MIHLEEELAGPVVPEETSVITTRASPHTESDDDTVQGEEEEDVEGDEETSPMLVTDQTKTENNSDSASPASPPAVVIDGLPAPEDDSSATAFGVSGRQDYRLDFTEVEGTLEAVPEEATAAPATTTITHTTVNSKMSAEESQVTSTPVQTTSSVPHFHIAESVISEYSDCSYQNFGNENTSRQSYMSAPFIRTSEPLSAKQQVALWLTRTSMTDVSSMPSLRSLIFPSSSSNGQKNSSKPQRGFTQDSVREKSRRKKSEVHRNFSTKSLINGYGTSKASASSSPVMMRKCETMMALSGNSSFKGGPGNGGGGLSRRGQSKRSSLNLFKRLTRRGGGSSAGAAPTNSIGRSGTHLGLKLNDTFGDSMCESPFRVSLNERNQVFEFSNFPKLFRASVQSIVYVRPHP